MNDAQESSDDVSRTRARAAARQALSRSWVEKPSTGAVQEIHITGIKIPFLSLALFMVKAAIAAVPALLILSTLVALLPFLLRAVLSIRF